ncbi:MAG: hypothetical protein WKG07_28490 [Hymenobacter sp.]
MPPPGPRWPPQRRLPAANNLTVSRSHPAAVPTEAELIDGCLQGRAAGPEAALRPVLGPHDGRVPALRPNHL